MMVARICEFVTEGLVLVPTAKAKGQFMRIGIFWVGNNNKNLQGTPVSLDKRLYERIDTSWSMRKKKSKCYITIV
jgi:hypothetical protein